MMKSWMGAGSLTGMRPVTARLQQGHVVEEAAQGAHRLAWKHGTNTVAAGAAAQDQQVARPSSSCALSSRSFSCSKREMSWEASSTAKLGSNKRVIDG